MLDILSCFLLMLDSTLQAMEKYTLLLYDIAVSIIKLFFVYSWVVWLRLMTVDVIWNHLV